MLLLTSTSDILRLVTGAAVTTIGVAAYYVDNASGTVTPGRTLSNITGATTTTIVGSPGVSTERNVRTVTISNNSASSSAFVQIQQFNGTISVDLFDAVLLAGETIKLDENGSWSHRDSTGAEYTYNVPAQANYGIAGTLAETAPRMTSGNVNTTAGATGTLFMNAINLTAGQLVSNITIVSATTAQATPTNYFFALYDANRNLLAQSANQTTTVWTANTVKTLAMTTPYRIPTTGIYYIGLLQVATTIATIAGNTAKLNAAFVANAPILHGTSTTGLTTALPNPAAAITAGTASIYAAVS